MSSQTGTEFGRITFEFETTCTADCELYFMMVGKKKKKNMFLRLCFVMMQTGSSLFFPGCEQEEHHGGGVMGRNQHKTLVHTRHDNQRLRFLHVGFPENQPAVGRKHERVFFHMIMTL